MNHSDFKIGLEFKTAAGKWRCTDIGTRVITAISLEPRDMVRSYVDESGEQVQEKYVSNDPRDLNGPPYSVVEHVFDEYDLEGCEGFNGEQWSAEAEKRVQEINAGAVKMLDGEKVFVEFRKKRQQVK